MHVWCKFGDSSPNIWRVLCGQAEFPGILSQNGQNDLEGQSQWPPLSMPAESIPGCMFGANLMILAQIYDELLCGQAKFPRILSQNDLEGHGQWPPFSIPAKSIPRCMFGAHLVIPAQICDELSCGQGKVYGQTHGQTQATTIPLRPERPRGKKHGNFYVDLLYHCLSHVCGYIMTHNDGAVSDITIQCTRLIDWYFISKKCTYIHINSTYRQIKSFICIQTYMYHLAAARETTSSLSELAAFRLVSTWLGHKLIIEQNAKLNNNNSNKEQL